MIKKESVVPKYTCLDCKRVWEEWHRPIRNCPYCRSTNIKALNKFGEIRRSKTKGGSG